MKITFHSRDPLDFCYDVASEIVKAVGGNIENTQVKVAKSFDYIFHFVQLKDKSQKRLKGIYELSICVETKKPKYTQICRYDYLSDNWKWFYEIGADKKEIGLEENLESYNRFSEELKKLSDASNYN